MRSFPSTRFPRYGYCLLADRLTTSIKIVRFTSFSRRLSFLPNRASPVPSARRIGSRTLRNLSRALHTSSLRFSRFSLQSEDNIINSIYKGELLRDLVGESRVVSELINKSECNPGFSPFRKYPPFVSLRLQLHNNETFRSTYVSLVPASFSHNVIK